MRRQVFLRILKVVKDEETGQPSEIEKVMYVAAACGT
jgi:hypothetical protein